MYRLMLVAGARPNFVKIAPVLNALERQPNLFECKLALTGQHYDHCLSGSFLRDLVMRDPDIQLNVGSGTHAQQTAWIMARLEGYLFRWQPDLVIVPGDTNSTLAAALTAVKMNIAVAHLESGLRSFDRTMPEELNRILTDHISSLHFVTEESGKNNLLNEGISASSIRFVGNTMIDSLLRLKNKGNLDAIKKRLGINQKSYAVATIHRLGNAEDHNVLTGLMAALSDIAVNMPVIFPVHPRTRAQLDKLGIYAKLSPKLLITDPLGYVDFIALMAGAKLVLTDSGGIQEETAILEVPCLTLRNSTERPCTVECGMNRVIGNGYRRIVEEANHFMAFGAHKTKDPDLWDGHASERVVEGLIEYFKNHHKAA